MAKHAEQRKDLATQQATGGAVANRPGSDPVPEYIKTGGQARGAEEVKTEDLIIPRLEIAQALSPCLDTGHKAFIEGCKVGDIYNSVTREVYGPKVVVIPIKFSKAWLVWRDRKKGGGFRGAFPTPELADARIQQEEKPDEFQANETAQEFVLVLHEDGFMEEAVVSMARTKLKVARNWNSLMRIHGGDTFARYYIIMSVDEQNANGDRYKNFGVLPGKWAPQPAYQRAESIYDGLTRGTLNAKVDENYDDIEGDAEAGARKEY